MKNTSIEIFYSDGLREVLTLNYQSKEEEKVHETLDKCIQWVDPRAEIVDEDEIKVTLPPLNIIPDVKGKSCDNLNLSFLGVDGSAKHALSLYTEERQPGQDGGKYLNIGYFGIIYSLTLRKDDYSWGSRNYVENDEMIDLTINGNEITSTSTKGQLVIYKDITAIDSVKQWTKRDIQSVALGVVCGEALLV